jgi:hypothetical protein
VQYNKRAVQKIKNPQEEHTVTIQKKSLISTLNTTKKAIVASSPAEAASVSPATKNAATRNAATRNAATRNAATRNAATRNAAKR